MGRRGSPTVLIGASPGGEGAHEHRALAGLPTGSGLHREQAAQGEEGGPRGEVWCVLSEGGMSPGREGSDPESPRRRGVPSDVLRVMVSQRMDRGKCRKEAGGTGGQGRW